MEINLYLTLEKSLTVKGVDLFNTNNDETINSFDMKYKDSWSQTFTCAKCKLLLHFHDIFIVKFLPIIFKCLTGAIFHVRRNVKCHVERERLTVVESVETVSLVLLDAKVLLSRLMNVLLIDQLATDPAPLTQQQLPMVISVLVMKIAIVFGYFFPSVLFDQISI